MNKSKKLYKEKVKRKYVEFYPTEKPLIDYIEIRQKDGINFATLVKALISLEAYMYAISKAQMSANEVTKGLIRYIEGINENGNK